MPEYRWSGVERWAWEEIRAGRVADFNIRDGRARDPLDPRQPDGWDDKRKLGPGFLRKIICEKFYKEEVPSEGVRIIGAWFPEPITLAHGRLNWRLWLDRCRFEGTTDFKGLYVDGTFSLEGSAFAAQGTASVSVDLTAAEIGGRLNLDSATVAGALDMNGIEVGRHLFMGKSAQFQDVDLTAARVGGELVLDGATVAGVLDMRRLEVGQHLFMRGPGASFQGVDLTNARVTTGQLNMTDATVAGALDMNGIEVGRDLLMRGARFEQPVSLIFARIGSNLDLSGAEVGDLDLSGTRIAGELRLGSARRPRIRWRREGAAPRLNLTNAHAGALQDRRDRVTRPWWRRLLGDQKGSVALSGAP